jgi:membrane associated rhomboid family serine protease
MQTCYRHADRRAGVICQRCDRPICPDCMRQASVGFHCPECTKTGAQKVVRPAQLLRPLVTQILVGINLAIFVAGIGAGLQTRERVIAEGGLIGLGFNPFTQEIIGVATGEWYRIVTGGFLHANLIHVGFNMFILYRLGQALEPALGRGRFLLVYFVSLLGGSFGVLLIDPNQFTVGASGAVFGIMGAAVAVFRARGVNVMDSGLGTTILLNLALTFAVPGISIGGHVGGLVAGYVAGEMLMSIGPRFLKDPNVAVGSVVALGLLLAAGSILVA